MKRFVLFASAVLVLFLNAGCTDNAIRLRRGIEKAAGRLYRGPDARQEVVRYTPVAAPQKPYWLIFFPEGRTRKGDLVQAGLPTAVAAQIFRDLEYVNVGNRRHLVVWQPGERLTFSDYQGREPVIVKSLIVAKGQGPAEIVLRKEAGVLYLLEVR